MTNSSYFQCVDEPRVEIVQGLIGGKREVGASYIKVGWHGVK